jgi:hypothetical protein
MISEGATRSSIHVYHIVLVRIWSIKILKFITPCSHWHARLWVSGRLSGVDLNRKAIKLRDEFTVSQWYISFAPA